MIEVSIRVHLLIGGVPAVLGPYIRQLVGHVENSDLLVLDKARELLTGDEFSRDLSLKHYFVSVKHGEEGQGGLENGVKALYDVYCVRAQQSETGITGCELAAELKKSFELSDVDRLVSWQVPLVDQEEEEEGGKVPDKCPHGVFPSEPRYWPGSAFLIPSGRRSVSSSYGSGPFCSLPPANGGDHMEGFREAHRETERGPTSTRQSGQRLVGIIQHKSQSQDTKSDQSRRRDTERPPPTTMSSLPPLQSHRELAGGGTTSNTTTYVDVREVRTVKFQSSRVAILKTTTTEAVEHSSKVDSWKDEGSKTKLNNTVRVSNDVDHQEGVAEGEEEERAEGLFGQGSPARTLSPPRQTTQMTNGLGLPAVSMISGVPMVPRVRSSMVNVRGAPQEVDSSFSSAGEAPQEVNSALKASSKPRECPDGESKHLEGTMSCEELRLGVGGGDEGEIRGTEGKCDRGGNEEEEEEEAEGEQSAEKTLAVPRVQELRVMRKEKAQAKLSGLSQIGTESEELKKLHALEHACNGQDRPCHLNEQNPSHCNQLYDGELVEEMQGALLVYEEGGPLVAKLRTIILRHCDDCRDSDCRVPHTAAGCSPAGISYTQSPSLLRADSQTASSPPPLPPRPTPSSTHLPAQDTHPPDPHTPPSPPKSQPSPSLLHTDHSDTSQDSHIAPLPPPHPHAPPLRSLSFDFVPANCSLSHPQRSPPRSPSSLPGAPTTLHTVSDSPHHHVTHLPPGPTGPSLPTSAMVAGRQMLMPRSQFKSTCYQGTFSPSVRSRDMFPATVAQATADIPSSGILPLSQCFILTSEDPERFPHRSKLPLHKVLFSRNPNVIMGTDMCLDGMEKSHLLGKGGNGKIYRYPLLNTEYAVKLTLYRPSELSEWRKFDHPNITALLMVTGLHGAGYTCYQFMTLMDGNLRGMTPSGGVYSLYCGEEWEREIMPNVRHIVRGVVQGTAYLHENMSIQHVDLKASNVLIKMRCGCSGGVFRCSCGQETKCLVKLSDFDSVKTFQGEELLAWHQEWWPYVGMSPEECEQVMGTPGYRAPEQFVKLAPVVSPCHPLWSKSKTLEGPWTDIWSLGLLVLSVFLGPTTHEDRHKARIMNCQPNVRGFSRKDVIPELFHALMKTLKLSQCSPRDQFTDVSRFVSSCTEAEFYKRPSAMKLIDHEMLK